MREIFTLQHKETGELMPIYPGQRRGFTHWEPTQGRKKGAVPRLFASALAAERARRSWAAGVHVRKFTGFYEDACDEIEVQPRKDRCIDDLLILRVHLAVSK